MEVVEKKKGLVPKLRFSEFENNWHFEQIGRHIKLDSGFAFKGEDISEDSSGTPLLRGINITEGRIRHSKDIDRYFLGDTEKFSRYLIQEGDLVLGMDGSKVGKNVAIISKEDAGSLLIQRVARLKAKKTSDIQFIYQHIFSKKFHRYVDVVNTSSGIPHISSKQINEFKIGFPTLPEQQKIAAFLSAVDEKIQQLRQKKALLEKYKKGVMQKLFPKKAGEAPELRFKKPDGSNYPDWQEKKLGEVGKTFNGLTGKTKENFGKGEPYIQYMQIFSSSKIKPEEFGLVEINPGENQNKANYGDVFFTTSSETPKEIGTASVYMETETKAYLNSFCFGYRPNDVEILTAGYSQFLFRSESFRRNVIPLAQGSTRYNISKVELMKVSIPLPSKEEQQKIADFLSGIDQKINQVETQINQTQTFKKGLLQQMFV